MPRMSDSVTLFWNSMIVIYFPFFQPSHTTNIWKYIWHGRCQLANCSQLDSRLGYSLSVPHKRSGFFGKSKCSNCSSGTCSKPLIFWCCTTLKFGLYNLYQSLLVVTIESSVTKWPLLNILNSSVTGLWVMLAACKITFKLKQLIYQDRKPPRITINHKEARTLKKRRIWKI